MTRLDMGDSAILVEVLRQHERSGGRVRTAIEIGCHRGETAAALLRAFPNLILTCADPWTVYPPDHPYRLSGDGCSRLTLAEQEDNMAAAKAATVFADGRCWFIRGTSRDANNVFAFSGVTVDVAFIDGDHTLDAVRSDIEMWWPFVLPGGLLCGHDYGHPRCRRQPNPPWGVDQAVNEFVSREQLKLDLFGTVWVVKKPG